MKDDLNSLFGTSDNPSKPFLHEVLQRDAQYNTAFQEWMLTQRYDDVKQLLHQYFILNDDTGINTTLERTQHNGSNGVRITYTPAYFEKQELQFMADAWKKILLQQQYKTYISDIRHFLRNDFVEIVERHYMKPKLQITDNPVLDQLYGNVIIENRMINETPFDLHLQVHYYTGRNYSPAISFESLLEILLQ